MTKRLLILDDEALIAWGLADELEDLGWSVAVVGTSAAALSAIASDTVDAAVLDYNLRDETSEGVARAMIEKGLPFIFVSGTLVGNLPAFDRPIRIVSKPIDYRKVHADLIDLQSERQQENGGANA